MTIPIITYLTFERYNLYNPLLTEYRFGYIDENGNSGDALTDSFVPVNATTEQIIRNHILPLKNWASATYNNQTYYMGTARLEGTTVTGGGGEKKSDNTVLLLLVAVALGLVLLGGKK